MQITNLLSESLLTLSGFLTYYFLLRKLPISQIILWGTFILSVSITSFFSALYFLGVSGMNQWHDFFKNIGSSTGIILLIFGIYTLVFKKVFSPKNLLVIIVFGYIIAFVGIFLNLKLVFEITPLIGILIVLIFGIIAFFKGNKKLSLYLLLATFFSILANTFNFLRLPINSLIVYCFFLSCVLIWLNP